MNGDPYYTSKELEDLWGLGNVVIGRVTYQSVGYTAKYCLKRQKNNMTYGGTNHRENVQNLYL